MLGVEKPAVGSRKRTFTRNRRLAALECAATATVVDPGLTAKLIDHCLENERLKTESQPVADEFDSINVLSPREKDVLIEIARGCTNAEISSELHLAESTVKSHINSIFSKIHLRDRVHAVIFARRIWPGL